MESPVCTICGCGNEVEDAEYIFKDCDRIQEARDKMWRGHRVDLRQFDTPKPLEGNPEESKDHNSKPFAAVPEYINLTKMFH